MKDEEEQPITDNRLSCRTMFIIIIVIWGFIIFECIKMCN